MASVSPWTLQNLMATFSLHQTLPAFPRLCWQSRSLWPPIDCDHIAIYMIMQYFVPKYLVLAHVSLLIEVFPGPIIMYDEFSTNFLSPEGRWQLNDNAWWITDDRQLTDDRLQIKEHGGWMMGDAWWMMDDGCQLASDLWWKKIDSMRYIWFIEIS